MDPSGNGKIKITMPPWWTNADLSLPFYDPSTPTRCTMNCANVLTNPWDDGSQSLTIFY